MINREAATTLKQLSKSFPVLAITGPRQSGKTTLVQACFPKKPYTSLEELDNREFAEQDPRGFLAQYPEGAILDEVQRCPQLFSYLQSLVDKKKIPGMFVLTGSQQFDLLSGITQSLAGRVALLSLLPFSLKELQDAKLAPASIERVLFQGMYPPVYDLKPNPLQWYDSYIQTYVERDVRRLISIRDLSSFQRFVRICAAHTGQLVNLSSMASDCGIDHGTARAWISVLEASYIVHLLRPHFNNFNKRLVKSPKLYFLDTGLVCRLFGLQTAEQLITHPQRGAIFETWVLSGLLKMRWNQALSSNLYFWRDRSGTEIDILVEQAGKLLPIEIKSGQTLNSEFFSGLLKWKEIAEGNAGGGVIIYGGKQKLFRQSIHCIPWDSIGSLQESALS